MLSVPSTIKVVALFLFKTYEAFFPKVINNNSTTDIPSYKHEHSLRKPPKPSFNYFGT